MKIPKQFNLAGHLWKVEYMDAHDSTDLGLTISDAQIIKLKKGLNKQTEGQTFIHELVHAIKFTMGFREEHNEQEVEAFSQLLYQYLICQK